MRLKRRKRAIKRAKRVRKPRISIQFFVRKEEFFDPEGYIHMYTKLFDNKEKRFIKGDWDEDHALAIAKYYANKKKGKLPFKYERKKRKRK